MIGWLLCKVGVHFDVEFVGHTFCMRCGRR